MNSRQKQVQQSHLSSEKGVIDRLQGIYGTALQDITEQIEELTLTIDGLQQQYDWMDDDDPKKQKVKSQLRAKINQREYQRQLKRQVGGILGEMQKQQFTTIQDYLGTCYTDGFIGNIFDLHGQGIPIITPIDQSAMVQAVQHTPKISQGLYKKLGQDVTQLRDRITMEVSRGILTGMSFADVARNIQNQTRIGYNRAVRIARTEGHRVQVRGAYDAMEDAVSKGCDVVKQWDATLDSNTRESHAKVDGEFRELKEKFSNGLLYPADPNGGASEVVNCRCALLQRAKWALDEDELETLRERAKFFGLDKTTQFDDFKKRYLQVMDEPVISSVDDCTDFDSLFDFMRDKYNVTMDNALRQLSFEAIKQPMLGIQDMFERYPALADSIVHMGTTKKCVMSCNGEKFFFNPDYFTDPDLLRKKCEKNGTSGWWVKGSTVPSIGVHECAHGLEWLLIEGNPNYSYFFEKVEAWNKGKEAKAIVSQACKTIKKTEYGKGKKNAELITSISQYANETASETLAEAFADVAVNGENANPLSLEIHRLTEQLLRERGILNA